MEDLLPVMVSSFPPSRPLSGRLLEFFGYYWWETKSTTLPDFYSCSVGATEADWALWWSGQASFSHGCSVSAGVAVLDCERFICW